MARAKSHVIRIQNTHDPRTKHLRELPLTIDPPLQVGLTPLMIAAMMGSFDVTKILLEGKHIDLNIRENVGLPVIHSKF